MLLGGALYCASWEAICKTFVKPMSSTILMGLQFVAIHLTIVSASLSEVDLLRPRRSVRVVCGKLGDALSEVLAKSPANVCLALKWYFKLEVLRWKENSFLQSVHTTLCRSTVPSCLTLNLNFPPRKPSCCFESSILRDQLPVCACAVACLTVSLHGQTARKSVVRRFRDFVWLWLQMA